MIDNDLRRAPSQLTDRSQEQDHPKPGKGDQDAGKRLSLDAADEFDEDVLPEIQRCMECRKLIAARHRRMKQFRDIYDERLGDHLYQNRMSSKADFDLWWMEQMEGKSIEETETTLVDQIADLEGQYRAIRSHAKGIGPPSEDLPMEAWWFDNDEDLGPSQADTTGEWKGIDPKRKSERDKFVS